MKVVANFVLCLTMLSDSRSVNSLWSCLSEHDTSFFGEKVGRSWRVKLTQEGGRIALVQFATSRVVFGLIREFPFIFRVNE